MASTRGDFKDLIASYNEVSTGSLRGVEAFCRLLEIQSQLRIGHHLDPAQDSTYLALDTTHQKFNSLLCEKYFLAARQNYEGATDEHFIGAGRAPFEALSDLHLVPVYMELGKRAVGNTQPVVAENWRKIGITKEDYDALVRVRVTDEAKRVWGLAKERTGDYHSFTNVIHEVGLLLRRAGLDLTEEKTYQALGTTKAEFDDLMLQRQQREQARGLSHRQVALAVL